MPDQLAGQPALQLPAQPETNEPDLLTDTGQENRPLTNPDIDTAKLERLSAGDYQPEPADEAAQPTPVTAGSPHQKDDPRNVQVTGRRVITGVLKQAGIELDIEEGDILLGGRFKNVRVVVKEIGKDENGQPTINGRKLLSYRIEKLMPKEAADVAWARELLRKNTRGKKAKRLLAYVEKNAGEPRLRPRVEVIIYNDRGIVAIKKATYLLCPGGGIDEGETPVMAVIRESIEEADRKLLDLEPMGEVEAVWPKDNILVDGFDGEHSHFFLARDGGNLGTEHDDNEPFKTIPFSEVDSFLEGLMDDEKQAWASGANRKRMQCLVAARQQAEEGRAAKQASAAEDTLIRHLCIMHVELAKVAERTNSSSAQSGKDTSATAAKPAVAASRTLYRQDGAFGPVVVRDQAEAGGMARQLLIGSEVQGACRCGEDGEPTAVSTSPYTHGWLMAGSQRPAGRALMIGLGSGAGAISLLHNFPDLKLTVVEIDPVVACAALQFFPMLRELQKNDRLELVLEDASKFLSEGDERWDFGMADAYTGDNACHAPEQMVDMMAKRCDDLWFNVIDRFDGESLEGVLLSLGRAKKPATWVFDVHPKMMPWSRRNIIVTSARLDREKALAFQPYKRDPSAKDQRDEYRTLVETGFDLTLG